MATKEGVRSRYMASVDKVLSGFWHVFFAFTRNIPKKLIRSIGLGDYIHHRAVGTQYRNGFSNPTPSNYFVVCAYISAFAVGYRLTYSQLACFIRPLRETASCIVLSRRVGQSLTSTTASTPNTPFRGYTKTDLVPFREG